MKISKEEYNKLEATYYGKEIQLSHVKVELDDIHIEDTCHIGLTFYDGLLEGKTVVVEVEVVK